MEDCTPRRTPIPVRLHLRRSQDKNGVPAGLAKAVPELTGGLLYLSSNTFCNIAHAVGVQSRAMAAPTKADWEAAKGVLRYLKETEDAGIIFGGNSRGFKAYCDADFAGDMEARECRTAYFFILNGGALAWGSRLQPTVAASTTKAKYMAVSQATKKALWLRTLLQDPDVMKAEGIKIGCNDQGALAMVDSTRTRDRAKHDGVQHYFMRERVRRREVDFYNKRSTDQKVNFLTKAFGHEAFARCKAGVSI
jgi:hypothetical protein